MSKKQQNESVGEQEEEEKEEEEEPLDVPSATMALQEAIANVANMLEERDGEGDEQRIAFRTLLEAVANLRAAWGMASDSEEDQQGPSRGLSAAMVQRRRTIHRVVGLATALRCLQATHNEWEFAHAVLLSWQEQGASRARRGDTEAEAKHASKERELQETLDMAARASARARQDYLNQFANLRGVQLQEPSTDSEESKSDLEEVKQEQDPPRVPSASIQQQQPEEEKQEQEPPGSLSAAMVRQRRTQRQQLTMQALFAEMRGFQLGARGARENLLAWQANNAGHAHAQDPEALTNYHIEQQVLQNQVAMWERAYVDARQRASDVGARDSSENSEDSKDAESEQENEDEHPEIYGVVNDLSDNTESSRISDGEFEICSSETEVERPAKRTKLFTSGPSLPAQARMARLRERKYQTRYNEHLIQGQEALDAATVIRRRNLNREIVEADEKERKRQASKQKMQVDAWWRRKGARIVTAPSQPPVAEQVESQQQSQPDENESDDDRKLTPEELEAQNKKEHKD